MATTIAKTKTDTENSMLSLENTNNPNFVLVTTPLNGKNYLTWNSSPLSGMIMPRIISYLRSLTKPDITYSTQQLSQCM